MHDDILPVDDTALTNEILLWHSCLDNMEIKSYPSILSIFCTVYTEVLNKNQKDGGAFELAGRLIRCVDTFVCTFLYHRVSAGLQMRSLTT